MRRTNSRGSRSHANGARRASSSRSRTARSKRSRRPHLTQRQVREIVGVLLILAGLLGLLAVASHAGSILAGLQEWLVASFGRAWFVPVVAAVALGAYMLWPNAPRPRLLDVAAGTVAVIALVGIFGLAAQAGGSAGRSIDRVVVGLAGLWGAWALLVAGLVIGLIVSWCDACWDAGGFRPPRILHPNQMGSRSSLRVAGMLGGILSGWPSIRLRMRRRVTSCWSKNAARVAFKPGRSGSPCATWRFSTAKAGDGCSVRRTGSGTGENGSDGRRRPRPPRSVAHHAATPTSGGTPTAPRPANHRPS